MKDEAIKIGDLVAWKSQDSHVPGVLELGLVLDWYDSGNGYVEVLWKYHDREHIAPCHISKLEVVGGRTGSKHR